MDNNDVINSLFKDTKPPTTTDIICIVDRSGSMGTIRKDAEGGVNAFIKDQQETGDNANLTLIEFDSIIDTLYESKKISDAPKYHLQPRGATSLLDAIGVGINSANDNDNQKIVVIVTDGGENSSKEYNHSQINKLITEKKEENWEFIFLAANQDAIDAGSSLGISAEHSINFAATSDGVDFAYSAASMYVKSVRTTGDSVGATANLRSFVDSQDETISPNKNKV